MTATSARPLAGLGRVAVLGLRTCWGALVLVCVASAALVTAVARNIAMLYPSMEERIGYAVTAGASVPSAAFNGRGYGLTTLGGITAAEVGFMGQVLFPLVGVLAGVRLTRREEEDGRVELLTASRVGRLAPFAASAVLLAFTALVTGAVMTAGMAVAGLPWRGSAWYSGAAGSCVFFFAAVGLVLAQLCQETRTAQQLGTGVVSAAFLVRFIIDGMQWGAVWASPLGWLPEVRAFDGPRAWPLIAYGVGALLLLAVGCALCVRRDLGSGVLAPRPGPVRGPERAVTPWRLAAGLERAATVVWTLLAVVWALLIGLFSEEVTRNVNADPTLLGAMGLTRGTDLMVQLAAVVIVATAGAIAVQRAARLGAEESSGRLGALLSTRLARRRLWAGWWGTTLASCLVALGAGALALAAGIWAVTGEKASALVALQIAWGYAVPVVLIVAVESLLAALGPRWHVAGWALVVWTVVVGFLAGELRLSEWARDLSVTHAVGVLPADDPDPRVIVAEGVAALVLMAVAQWVFGRRDLRAG